MPCKRIYLPDLNELLPTYQKIRKDVYMQYIRIILSIPVLLLGFYRSIVILDHFDIFNFIITLVLLVLGYLLASKGIKELRAQKAEKRTK